MQRTPLPGHASVHGLPVGTGAQGQEGFLERHRVGSEKGGAGGWQESGGGGRPPTEADVCKGYPRATGNVQEEHEGQASRAALALEGPGAPQKGMGSLRSVAMGATQPDLHFGTSLWPQRRGAGAREDGELGEVVGARQGARSAGSPHGREGTVTREPEWEARWDLGKGFCSWLHPPFL